MAEVASAYVSLLPSTRGFGTKMSSGLRGEVSGAGTTLGRTFGRLFAAAGGVIAVAALGRFLKDSIAEAREAQKVNAITEQIIKSTGGAAKVTAKQVADLATAISLKTGKDDEAIQTASNLLLTFKLVRNEVGKSNDVFNQATQAAVDLSAAGFGSMDSAAKMLGKALNDPLKGLTALSRAGVTFTEQQQARIKGLIEEGKLLRAQKIILGEVQSQVGGVAEASATAGEKAAVAWANLKEQIGTALLPVIDRLATFLTEKVIPAVSAFIVQIQTGVGAGGVLRDIFMGVVAVLGPLFTLIGENSGLFATLAAGIGLVTVAMGALTLVLDANPVVLLAVAIAALVFALVAAYKRSEAFRNIVDQTGAFLRDTFQPAIEAVGDVIRDSLIPATQSIIAKFREWWPAIKPVVEWLAKTWAQALQLGLTIVGKVLPPIIRFADFLAKNVVKSISMMVTWIGTAITKFVDFAGQVKSTIDRIPGLSTAINGVIASIKTLVTWIGNAISALIRLLSLQGDVAFKGQVAPGTGPDGSMNPNQRSIAPAPRIGELVTSNGTVVGELRAIRAEMARNTAATTAAPDRFGRVLNGAASDGQRRRASAA